MTSNYARIDWQNGQPVSKMFGDVYFSREGGLEETQYVFLTHNQLQERWQLLKTSNFTIAETGFGTGLNFLSCWQLWNNLAPSTACLHFISTEKYPLSHADLSQALSLWPQLAEYSRQLLIQYRWMSPGWHTLVFDQGRVTLTLVIGDARDTLMQLVAQADAWFLDGFAPARNPEMWQTTLFMQMARLSHAETTFATFTSAGAVKRGLEAAGFEVRKVTGHGRKREMLCGRYTGSNQRKHTEPNQHAIVIGGGIAGTSCSHALASRGWQVTLIERHAALAQEASGNPVGILYPRLSKKEDALDRLNLQGFLHTLRLLRRLPLETNDYGQCGLLQLGFNARELDRCLTIAARGLPADLVRHVSSDEARRLAGIEFDYEGLYFPDGGWVNPAVFCTALAQHRNITLMASTRATRLTRKDSLWQVWNEDYLIAEAPVVVLASANDTAHFEQSQHLPLEPVRGQITLLPESKVSLRVKTVVCSDGYMSPVVNGVMCVGATFSPENTEYQISESDHQANLAMLGKISTDFYKDIKQLHPALSGRVGFRCSTPDYLPMAGQLIDKTSLEKNPPRHDAELSRLPWLDGLYVNTGFGSKGLTSAPLCAEILARTICGEPAPVDARLIAALSPNRFLLRKMGLKRMLNEIAFR